MDHHVATVAFLRALARAETESAAEAWPEAAALWERVVAVNPVEGRFWSKLAEARRGAKEYRAAIDAYEQAFTLRDGFPAESVYAIACCYSLRGEREEALAAFERALALGYRHLDHAAKDDDLAALRDDARFRGLVGLTETNGLSRDEGWRLDLRFLALEVKRRAYDPFRHQSEEDFDAAVVRLGEAIPDLSDLQIVVAMSKLLRPLGDGHAWVWPPDDDEDFRRRLPVQFYLFAEGLFIVAASPEHAGLLGARVRQFGERTAEEATAAVDVIIHRDNDNSQWPKQGIPRLPRVLPLLHALDVASSSDEIILTVETLTGETRENLLRPVLMRPGAKPFPYPDDLHPAGWCFFPDTLPAPLPLYLRNVSAAYWFTSLKEERAVYFQCNAVRDDSPETLDAFTGRLFRFIADNPVDKLVIDLRWNGGGNLFLELPLLHRQQGQSAGAALRHHRPRHLLRGPEFLRHARPAHGSDLRRGTDRIQPHLHWGDSRVHPALQQDQRERLGPALGGRLADGLSALDRAHPLRPTDLRRLQGEPRPGAGGDPGLSRAPAGVVDPVWRGDNSP